MAWEPMNNNNNADRRYDRHEATIWQHSTDRRQDTTHTGNRDYQRSTSQSTTQPNNTQQNQYAALNSDATCDDAHTTRTPDTWTVVTHKRKRTTGKDTMPTLSRPDPSKDGPQSRLGTAKVEAHIDESTCGDAHTEVEAHAGVPAHGDAHPSPIPSPNHWVTPLTKFKVPADGPTGGDACPSSSVCNIGVTLLEDDKGSDDEGIPPSHHAGTIAKMTTDDRNENAQEQAKFDKGVTNLCMQSSKILERHRQVHAATLTGGEALPAETSRQENSQRMRDPMRRAERYCETLGPLTDEEKHDAISCYLMEGRWTSDNKEDILVKPAPRTLTVAGTSAGYSRQTEKLEPLRQGDADLKPHDALLEHQTKHRRNLLIAIGRATEDNVSHNPEKSSNGRDETTTPSENPIDQMTKTTDANCKHMSGENSHVMTETPTDDGQLTPGDTLDNKELWDAFTRDNWEVMLSRLLGDSDVDENSPEESNTQYGSAYETRKLEDPDDMEDTLSDLYSELAYWTHKSEDEDNEPFYDKEYYDNKDKYSVPPLGEDDNEALDFGEGERDDTQPRRDEEHSRYRTPLQHTCPVNPAIDPQHKDDKSPDGDGDTLFDLSNGLTGWTYGTEDSDDEYGTSLQRNHDAYLQHKDNKSFYRKPDTEARLPSLDDIATPDGRRGKRPNTEGTSTLTEKKPGVDRLAGGNAIPPPLLCPCWASLASPGI
ncbi:hypothetical protein EDB83DRAFT_2312082 [Lactarius deliciosus]|nr:hypothetical protein EDB83DRAFT_2312082 [Lactarius deliciosus]